ncbi:ferredoxin [Nocardia sp. NBC_01327]|uniref:ferredoxin n=1 Tax=Nocardia sp. NBC_01327 TaxID=2903593 RepID=UPI002E15E206|nr:ferredoxin [Nocardia sp. NBC_01327]
MYWDPLPTVAVSHTLPIAGAGPGSALGPPSGYLLGVWSERDWRNVPGPFYGAQTDSCGTGPLAAPDHVLCEDKYGSEVVFRQPRTVRETQLVLTAAWSDPFAGYACDGDDHWTLGQIRQWWADRTRLVEWIDRVDHMWSVSDHEYERAHVSAVRAYHHYLEHGLENELREYGFWLEHRRAITPTETLPDLGP